LPSPRKSIRPSLGSRLAGHREEFKALGFDVAVEPGAGLKSGLPDSEFTAVGATVGADAVQGCRHRHQVKRARSLGTRGYKRGAMVIAIMDPMAMTRALKDERMPGCRLRDGLMPRITRAQVMDVLSSQATSPATVQDRGRRSLRRAFR